eukprot:gene8125-18157_t
MLFLSLNKLPRRVRDRSVKEAKPGCRAPVRTRSPERVEEAEAAAAAARGLLSAERVERSVAERDVAKERAARSEDAERALAARHQLASELAAERQDAHPP